MRRCHYRLSDSSELTVWENGLVFLTLSQKYLKEQHECARGNTISLGHLFFFNLFIFLQRYPTMMPFYMNVNQQWFKSCIHPFSTLLMLNRLAGVVLEPLPDNFGQTSDNALIWSPISHRAHIETNNHSHPQPHHHLVGTDPTLPTHNSGECTITPSAAQIQ